MRIDAHVHFWDWPQLDAYEWMTDDMAKIRRPFSPHDLRPHLTAHGVEQAVLVQTHSSVDETRDFLALAAVTDFVGGVVGWLDLTSPALGEMIDELRARADGRYLVGVRHQVHDEPDPEWLVREDVRRGLRTLDDAGLAYDVLVRTRELPAALAVAREFSEMRLVIDHIAKPPIASGEVEPWASRMAPFAELDHVFCKVSGLVTEAHWERWEPDDVVPYVQRVAEWFDQDRLLFGSDWPVCTLAASYDDVVSTCEYVLGDVASSARDQIFGENAARFYRLPDVSP